MARIIYFALMMTAVIFAGSATISAAAPKEEAKLRLLGDRLQFATTDGRTENVRIDQIWRVRKTRVWGEPKGRVVVDYAFTRLYVLHSLDDVIRMVGDQVKLEKFTMPGGASAYIVVGKIVDVQRALRARDHPKSKALITTREGTQQVRESKTKVLEMIGQQN